MALWPTSLFPMSSSEGMPTARPWALSVVKTEFCFSQSRCGVDAWATMSPRSPWPIPTPSMMTSTTGPVGPENVGCFSNDFIASSIGWNLDASVSPLSGLATPIGYHFPDQTIRPALFLVAKPTGDCGRFGRQCGSVLQTLESPRTRGAERIGFAGTPGSGSNFKLLFNIHDGFDGKYKTDHV